jgi:signal transduction histidine kinase/streptogramin lyase
LVKNYSEYNSKTFGPVGAIFKDKDQQIWIGHSKGLIIFDESKNSFREIPLSKELPQNLNDVFVNDIKQLNTGEILVATQWGLLLVQKSGKNYKVNDYYKVPYFGSQSLSIAQSKDGDIWIASPNAGLICTRFKDSLLPCVSYFKGVNIRSVAIDQKDNEVLWLSTAKGLVWFNSKKKLYRLYNENNGMANSYIYGVLQDEQGNLWISSNGGLMYFDRLKKRFQNYNVNDGLQSNEFNTGAFYKGPSGYFYFGGIKGYNWFKPIEIKNKVQNSLIQSAITNIYIDDELFKQDEAFYHANYLKLSHSNRKLGFNFAVLDFTKPRANKISYQLVGWDKEWISSNNKTVVYQNLPSGSYELQYKGINASGDEGQIYKLTIFVQGPYYKTWWFISLLLLFLFVTIFLIFRMIANKVSLEKLQENEKKKAVEEERSRISKDMHDEIGSGLTQISLISELIQIQEKTNEELQADVGTIANSARKLIGSMGEIIWALNPENDTFENLLYYLREQISVCLEPFELNYEIDFPQKVPPIKLSNLQRRNIFLVVKESLNNALKYAKAKNLRFTVSIIDSYIRFSIVDDGQGFDLTNIRRGANGLINMKKRMKDINGLFKIESDHNGTRINIEFQLPNDTIN